MITPLFFNPEWSVHVGFSDHVYFVHPSTDTSVDRLSTDVSVAISVEHRSICRPIYRSRVGRYVDRDVSVDISTDVYRPSDCRHIDRLSTDISVNIGANTRPIHGPLIVGGVSVDCRWYIDRVPYNISQKLRLSNDRCVQGRRNEPVLLTKLTEKLQLDYVRLLNQLNNNPANWA